MSNAKKWMCIDALFDDTGMFSEVETCLEDISFQLREQDALYEGSRDSHTFVAMEDPAVISAINAASSSNVGAARALTKCAAAEQPYSGMVVDHVIEAFVLYSNYAR